MTAPLLTVRGLGCSFGSLLAVHNVDLDLVAGARHALIGPNGAGKTTLVNLITGELPASAGSVALAGQDVSRADAASRARAGIGRTFQLNQLFRDLAVIDNVAMATLRQSRADRSWWRPFGHHREAMAAAWALLEDLGLADDALQPVRSLPYGRQRLVELALALATRPKLLLLDEPAAGVPSVETHLILDALDRLDPDVAVLMIEHDMDLVFRFARSVTVLVAGRVFAQGAPADIAADAEVQRVYMGEALE